VTNTAGLRGGPRADEADGKRGVTPQTAWLLAQALGTTPEFWLDLQSAPDLSRTRPARLVAPFKAAN
jgi:plasmid maintenance system antidote protein VapI